MELTITSLWITYVVSFIIFYLLTWLVCIKCANECPLVAHAVMAFVASILSGLTIIIITTMYPLSILDATGENWFNILLLVAIFLPIILFFYLIWAGGHKWLFAPKVSSTYVCDEKKCLEVSRVIETGNDTFVLNYK